MDKYIVWYKYFLLLMFTFYIFVYFASQILKSTHFKIIDKVLIATSYIMGVICMFVAMYASNSYLFHFGVLISLGTLYVQYFEIIRLQNTAIYGAGQ